MSSTDEQESSRKLSAWSSKMDRRAYPRGRGRGSFQNRNARSSSEMHQRFMDMLSHERSRALHGDELVDMYRHSTLSHPYDGARAPVQHEYHQTREYWQGDDMASQQFQYEAGPYFESRYGAWASGMDDGEAYSSQSLYPPQHYSQPRAEFPHAEFSNWRFAQPDSPSRGPHPRFAESKRPMMAGRRIAGTPAPRSFTHRGLYADLPSNRNGPVPLMQPESPVIEAMSDDDDDAPPIQVPPGSLKNKENRRKDAKHGKSGSAHPIREVGRSACKVKKKRKEKGRAANTRSLRNRESSTHSGEQTVNLPQPTDPSYSYVNDRKLVDQLGVGVLSYIEGGQAWTEFREKLKVQDPERYAMLPVHPAGGSDAERRAAREASEEARQARIKKLMEKSIKKKKGEKGPDDDPWPEPERADHSDPVYAREMQLASRRRRRYRFPHWSDFETPEARPEDKSGDKKGGSSSGDKHRG